uniref:Ubiquitin-like protease family profile domain-containing protein n=1 Tax=Brassica oleracea var. oleracea TaxID=109376 RepID=A0A0D3A7V4_BRAOL
MEMPEFPRRIYTLGEEPPAVHSISYHTCWTLHASLKKAIRDDEYEELKESKLGVFIKFQELGFDWASRLVHYMLGFQLDIKKKCWEFPLPNNPSPPILAYKGRKGRRQFKEAILSQTRVVNFVQKDIGQMFPKWEFDVEDTPVENIIKLMFVKKPWKWTMDCWEVTAKKKVVKEDSPRPRKKDCKEAPAEASEEAAAEASEEVTTTAGGLTEEDIKTMFKDIADAMRVGFGTCLKEIKYLSERGEAVEKNVGITTKRKGTSSQNTTSPLKPTLEPGHIDAWINMLRKRYDANPQHFRSERMCFLDHLFTQQWRFNFKDVKDSEPDQNGTIPSFCQSSKVWGTDIDDIYAPVNFVDTHWIAMWISIPKRHIVVFDNICSSISPEELDVVMEPFLYMVPYLLVECASSDELRAQYSLEPFTYERPANIPPVRAGDCGMYTLKILTVKSSGMLDDLIISSLESLLSSDLS